MVKAKKLIVKGISISTIQVGDEAYISITDIARNRNSAEPKDVVKNWMRSRTTIEFLGIWEQLYNPLFKGVEFDSFLFAAGSNSFTLSPSKWIETTNAKGMISGIWLPSSNWLFYPIWKVLMPYLSDKVYYNAKG